ncbi:hypothetical protein VDG64_21145 [Xanthomonas campestris pv. raphani]|uniref:Uncharacterized protein n=1 Tax=Xanthomonas axonopodis pv. cajani TaxID=487827 RepID=A0ABX3MGS5_9XANT|nr:MULTISPECIES: hypothetical protein [Xanthomonas]MEA9757441.1 hypothetical protein [Xanthomonas campestris pv. raphani]MEA9959224.1 hypothetical protein [Xanthomonas campestris pv. raphani]MEA9963271.1 hypothetical protein [Xanthomonas campestris pv. raphani]OOX22482.1 hypothetical protein Xcaj_19785 [Xanthomonas axonopodis pv. cajani]
MKFLIEILDPQDYPEQIKQQLGTQGFVEEYEIPETSLDMHFLLSKTSDSVALIDLGIPLPNVAFGSLIKVTELL